MNRPYRHPSPRASFAVSACALALVGLAGVAFGASASAATLAADAEAGIAPGAPPIRKLDGHLVDLKGRGIYTWDGDKVPGQSACMTQCRLLWPPIRAEDDAQPKPPFTLLMRSDGTRQWALRGRPLYRWASDKKYGDAGGDLVAGSWHLVKVAPAVAKPAAEATNPGKAATDPGKAATPARGNESKTPGG
jgi:predicted lipoprotein with Yx(FWY)xxD motif